MKNLLLLLIILSITYGVSLSQTKNDKLFLQHETKEVNVKEVSNNTIKYTYPGEDVIYSISKTLVDKIEFSNGRAEVFESPFQEVNSIMDVPKVFVTFNPTDVEGLEIKGDLFSKAVGVTTLSSVNNVNNRALKKLKTEATMMGANVLYIGNQFQRGNQFGNEYTPGNSTMTTYSAKAYSSNSLNIAAAKEMIENHQFYQHQRIELARNDWNPTFKVFQRVDKDLMPILFDLGEIIEKDGDLFLAPKEFKFKGAHLQVVRVGDDMITLMQRTDKSVVNYILLSDNNELVKNQIKMVQQRKENKNNKN
ncbi:hypothetical protein [Algoriphagus sp.]|uniref:hypothetical protein n=1 Tax=Algoriphagus sp. TaxID=1872435 RepID=UPI003283957F